MNIDELKAQAKLAKQRKQLEKAKDNPSQVRDGDSLLVLHSEELSLVEALLFDILEKDSSAREIYPNEKRIALNILKHMEVI